VSSLTWTRSGERSDASLSWVAVLGAVCAGAVLLAICAGPTGWRWPEADLISLRVPRALLAALVGGSLALAGVAMQAVLRNDLADPYVLGLSGGASAGAVGSLALAPGLPPGPAAALGAAAAAVLVRSLVRGPHDPARLLLSGVAVGAALSSATGLAIFLAPAGRLLRASHFWLFGGMGAPEWSALGLPAVLLTGALGWMSLRAGRLDRLTLGDEVATSLGVEVPRLRNATLALAIGLTAAAVAVSGMIGFVGLIAPHVARRVVGQGHRALVPAAALGGALLVVLADVLARTAFAPRELPVGLLTAGLGAPFFLAQLARRPR
jgi:iron complex transport system permease protein